MAYYRTRRGMNDQEYDPPVPFTRYLLGLMNKLYDEDEDYILKRLQSQYIVSKPDQPV